MDALRRVHEALVPEGILLDLMPFEAAVPVETVDGELGRLDAREFARDVVATVGALMRTVRDGLYELERESTFDVLEHFESADRLLEEVDGWRGTMVPRPLQARLECADPPFRVRQPLVLRRLRAR